MKLHIQSVHFSASQDLKSFIEKKFEKLSQFFDRIHNVQVMLKLENSGQIKDKVAEVKLELPGGVLYVKENTKSFEASVSNATDSLKRQIIKYKERLRMNA